MSRRVESPSEPIPAWRPGLSGRSAGSLHLRRNVEPPEDRGLVRQAVQGGLEDGVGLDPLAQVARPAVDEFGVQRLRVGDLAGEGELAGEQEVDDGLLRREFLEFWFLFGLG